MTRIAATVISRESEEKQAKNGAVNHNRRFLGAVSSLRLPKSITVPKKPNLCLSVVLKNPLSSLLLRLPSKPNHSFPVFELS